VVTRPTGLLSSFVKDKNKNKDKTTNNKKINNKEQVPIGILFVVVVRTANKEAIINNKSNRKPAPWSLVASSSFVNQP
jgi:hypothetical protein